MAKTYKIKEGDYLAKISSERGFYWKTIWEHPDNAEIKDKSNDPNILYMDDMLSIPDKSSKEESVPTEKRHVFKRKGLPHDFTPYDLIIDIQLDPEDLEVQDDTFTLFSTDEHKSYMRVQTVKNDQIPADDFVTLLFVGLNPNLSYTLQVDPGSDIPSYNLFADVKYSKIKKAEEQEGVLEPEENEEPENDWFEENLDEFDLQDEISCEYTFRNILASDEDDWDEIIDEIENDDAE
jgi:hypothetical protein